MMNNDLKRAYSIKEIGYKNSLLKKWVNLSFSKEQCQKKDDSKMENGQYKPIECNLSDKFGCGQELYIVLNKKLPKSYPYLLQRLFNKSVLFLASPLNHEPAK